MRRFFINEVCGHAPFPYSPIYTTIGTATVTSIATATATSARRTLLTCCCESRICAIGSAHLCDRVSAFVRSGQRICAIGSAHLCDRVRAFVRSGERIYAIGSAHLCDRVSAFVRSGQRICAIGSARLCDRVSAFVRLGHRTLHNIYCRDLIYRISSITVEPTKSTRDSSCRPTYLARVVHFKSNKYTIRN